MSDQPALDLAMSDRITLDLFIRTALALWERPENKGLGEDELFDATRTFLQRARLHHSQYVHGGQPFWYERAFLPPLLPLEEAAVRLTGEQNKPAALRALEKYVVPEAMQEIRKRGGLNADFCDEARKRYELRKKAVVREAKREGGKRAKHHLKQGPNKPGNTP